MSAPRPGAKPRMLGEHPGQAREDLAAYRGLGGYRTLAGVDELLAEVESSGLLGRGGAAFPLAVKLRAVRDNGRLTASAGGTTVVANGEEGEPASIKDRWLLRNRPHMVLDGLRLAAAIVEATRAYVYVSDADSARSVEAALSELDRRHARRGHRRRPDGGARIRGRRRDRGGPRSQRRPGQADRQAAAPVRRRRRRAAHPGEQCRDPGQSALPAAPRLGGVPLAGHVAVAGHVPCDHHRSRPTGRSLRDPARLAVHRTACPAWGFARRRAGSVDGRLFRRVPQPAACCRPPWTTRPSEDSAAGWAAVRSR